MPEHKDEGHPSTLVALGQGLNPTVGSGVLEKYGPIVALVLYFVIMLVQAFVDIPNPEALAVITGLLGPLVGAWVAKLGSTG